MNARNDTCWMLKCRARRQHRNEFLCNKVMNGWWEGAWRRPNALTPQKVTTTQYLPSNTVWTKLESAHRDLFNAINTLMWNLPQTWEAKRSKLYKLWILGTRFSSQASRNHNATSHTKNVCDGVMRHATITQLATLHRMRWLYSSCNHNATSHTKNVCGDVMHHATITQLATLQRMRWRHASRNHNATSHTETYEYILYLTKHNVKHIASRNNSHNI